jgi:hypothetical protein
MANPLGAVIDAIGKGIEFGVMLIVLILVLAIASVIIRAL